MIKKRKILDILAKYAEAKEVLVLTGFRRVGKTVVMRHIYENITSVNKLFLDLESPVNQKIFSQDNYENIKTSLAQLGLSFHNKAYVFLDEIQHVKNLPSAVKYLYDHNDIKFYLTGSSSFYLKNLFSESLSGRKFIFELYPLDFEEFLWFKDSKISFDADYDLLSGLYEEYLFFGGFPSVVLGESAEKKYLQLDDVLGSYFQLDVQTLADFRDNQKLKDLLFLLSSRVGNKPDMGKLAQSLGVSRQTVYEYLDFFVQTYLIHFLRPLSGSRDVQIKVKPKIYFCDTGILNRIAQVSKGQLFENKIFNQLFTRLSYEGNRNLLRDRINYYQLKTGTEIDFIVDGKTAYEVKLQGADYDVARLKRTSQKIAIDEYKVVSLEKVKGKSDKIIYPFGL